MSVGVDGKDRDALSHVQGRELETLVQLGFYDLYNGVQATRAQQIDFDRQCASCPYTLTDSHKVHLALDSLHDQVVG
jgi:hypothetical protein